MCNFGITPLSLLFPVKERHLKFLPCQGSNSRLLCAREWLCLCVIAGEFILNVTHYNSYFIIIRKADEIYSWVDLYKGIKRGKFLPKTCQGVSGRKAQINKIAHGKLINKIAHGKLINKIAHGKLINTIAHGN